MTRIKAQIPAKSTKIDPFWPLIQKPLGSHISIGVFLSWRETLC